MIINNMLNKIEIKAYAKINLALNVLEKFGDKHRIDTIMTNVNIYDTIRANKRKDKDINVTYTNTTNQIANDTAKKTALLLQKEYQTGGVDIFIEKKIPFAAGLGGSSADAAGVARCMQQLFDIKEIPYKLLLEVGSDTPYMYRGGSKRVKNMGEIIEDIRTIEAHYAIIVCPGGVSTAKAYALFDEIGGDCCDIDTLINCINGNKSVRLCNSLQKAATILNKNITVGLEYLKKAGFEQRVMTGSGSAVFGMKTDPNKFNSAFEKLKSILPDKYQLYRS